MSLNRKLIWLAMFFSLTYKLLIAEAKSQVGLVSNHPFSKVAQCEHDFVDINYCSERYVIQFSRVLKNKKPDFYKKYIIHSFKVFDNDGKFLGMGAAAADSTTGVIYILPFETYSGNVDALSKEIDKPKIEYNIHQNKVCFYGSTYGYRDINENTISCYRFNQVKVINGSNFTRVD